VAFLTLTEAKDAKASMGQIIRSVNVLSVDPASGGSSMPGYAVLREGSFVESGIIKLPKGGDVPHRLHCLIRGIQHLCDKHGGFGMLVIEDVPVAFGAAGTSKNGKRGGIVTRGSTYLQWSVGVTLASQPWPHVVKVMPQSWHNYLRRKDMHDAYVKDDHRDACVLLACAYEALTDTLPLNFDLKKLVDMK
jgi:hypothetical protein